MLDVETYRILLMAHLVAVSAAAVILFVLGNLLLLILKISKVFHERSVWLLANGIGLLVLAVTVIPVALDVQEESYCVVENVVSIECLRDKYGESILITDQVGNVYTCQDYLGDAEALESIVFPGTVVYAKHSKLMLDYYVDNS